MTINFKVTVRTFLFKKIVPYLSSVNNSFLSKYRTIPSLMTITFKVTVHTFLSKIRTIPSFMTISFQITVQTFLSKHRITINIGETTNNNIHIS